MHNLQRAGDGVSVSSIEIHKERKDGPYNGDKSLSGKFSLHGGQWQCQKEDRASTRNVLFLSTNEVSFSAEDNETWVCLQECKDAGLAFMLVSCPKNFFLELPLKICNDYAA